MGMSGWFVDIAEPDGSRRRAGLEGASVDVGRDAGATIRPDSTAVSRRHARVSRGEDGRWRVRDLGSRNGTTVNGESVGERVLAPGDRIGIGGFQLVLIPPVQVLRAAPAVIERAPTSVLLSDARARLDTLGDLGIPRLSAEHLAGLNRFSRTLLGTAAAGDRLAALCSLWVGGLFRAASALALRVRRGAGADEPPLTLHAARLGGPSAGAGTEYVSRSLPRAGVERGEAVMAGNVQTAARATQDVELSIAPGVATIAAAACPLRSARDEIDMLYVSLPPECGTDEWLALVPLASEQFQVAEEAWPARASAADHAALEREPGRATQIQRRLVPDGRSLGACRAAGIDAAVAFLPYREVGGITWTCCRRATGGPWPSSRTCPGTAWRRRWSARPSTRRCTRRRAGVMTCRNSRTA